MPFSQVKDFAVLIKELTKSNSTIKVRPLQTRTQTAGSA